jgi:tetratricopeptide (TPR) repeat protein
MEFRMRSLSAALLLCLASTSLTAQAASIAAEIRAGDSLEAALHPEAAVARFRAALALDSTSYEGLWKAARAVVNVAKQIDSDEDALKKRRDSLYVQARALAEAAVRANPRGAQGHSMVAQALGRLSRTRGGKERVRFAKTIYDEAMQALALDSTNDPADHVLGAWNAEIKRLSGMTRFFAKTLFGAGFMDKANWDDAQRYLVRAVALNPQNIYHRLELAQVYVDVHKFAAAREQLTAIHDLPIADVLDHKYKNDAEALLNAMRNKN